MLWLVSFLGEFELFFAGESVIEPFCFCECRLFNSGRLASIRSAILLYCMVKKWKFALLSVSAVFSTAHLLEVA